MEVNIWQTCFICCTNTDKNAKDIFTSNSLSDGTTLQDVISEVTDKPCLKGIDRNTVHSSVICEPCHDRLIDYHVMKLKLNAIKMRMTEDFSATTRKFNVNYSLSTAVIAACGKLPPPPPLAASAVRRLVLPASKLKPLPPDYVIVRPNQMPIKAGLQTPMKILSSRSLLSPNKNPPPVFAKIAPKQPVDPKPKTRTIDNQKKKTTNNSKLVLDATAVSGNSIASIFNKVTSDSMLKFNTNLPSNFMDGKVGSDGGERSGDSDDHGVDAGNQDDQSMEIDEECSAVTIQKHNTRNFQEIFLSAANKEQNLEIATETQEHSYTFESLPNLDATDENEPNEQETKFVIGKVEVMEQESNDTNGDEATIIMQDDDGSLIRMISGDKFMYGDNEISLIMPEDVSQGTDNPDSNDESQIELQVSGDEETANAIIAAAKEQGGAFIKVESGAVYRVNSVESKVSGDLMELKNDIVEQQGDSYKCLICKPSEDPLKPQFSCEGAKDMLSHIKEAHEMRAYVCAICGLFMKKRTEYSSHINKHREDASDRKASKKLKDSCKPSSSASQQGQDQANNAEGKPYTCEICQKGFVTRYTHQAHLKIHADRPRHFKCDKCSKSFFTFHHLQQHLKTHTASKDFVCKICDKAFGTQHNLQVHGVVHSGQRPYMCGVCEKCFARKAEIRDHMRTHTGERPFSCDICGASFSQRSNLQSHVRATHMNDRRHACDMCDRRFKRRRLLEYHKKAMHTGERPFQCGVCRATFVYPEHFKKHIRIHSGQKPFTCEVCGKSFNSRDNRNAHRFVHSDKKPYECLVCGAGFMRKPQLYAHMNTANHLTESIVVNQPRVSQGSDNEECLETVEEIEPKPEVPTAQDNEDALFTLTRNLESDTETEKGGETAVVGDGTEQNVHVVASDEGGGMVRLVQIQLPNGGKGWLAIN